MKRESLKLASELKNMGGFIGVSIAVACIVYLSSREAAGTQDKQLPCEEKPMISTDKTKKTKKRRKKPYLIFLSIISLCAIIIYFSLGVAQVNGKSMYPNFKDGDILVYSRLYNKMDYGDVIIFQKDHRDYVKRVVGKPGDTISISDSGIVLVNHSPLVLDGLMVLGLTEPRELKNELVLHKDEYFVLGDNRTVSLDSRNKEIGTVLKQDIIGVYLFGIKGR